MKHTYRVRFAGDSKYQQALDFHRTDTGHTSSFSTSSFSSSPSSSTRPSTAKTKTCAASQSDNQKPRRTKSKFSCMECRRRRVKCDETFPVCLRCQRRGSVCLASSRPVQWHTEMPWLSDTIVLDSWPNDASLNKRLLQYWVEQTSQLLSLDRNNNPLALPLLQHLTASPSLLHAIQSVSAGHENFFSNASLDTCLEERGRALRLVRQELCDLASLSISSIFTVFLLGISSSWIESDDLDSWGKQHLDGARAIIKLILASKAMREDPLARFLLGWYLYWDMTCSFLDDPQEEPSISAQDVVGALQVDCNFFHPIIGFSSELYAHVAEVGRYCRRALEYDVKNHDFEELANQKLLSWSPSHHDKHLNDLSLAYRNHGLMMLYRAGHGPMELTRRVVDEGDGTEETVVGTEAVIRSYAIETIRTMMEIPMSELCANFQSLPLLGAAAELMAEDAVLRENVIAQFKALYSNSRVLVHLRSIELLQELWSLRDCGVGMSWMELSLVKGWKLCFS
ncbi:Zn(2)-C6 fungal-type domain-containing protein [Fusarium keratoplasticum]|nr:Zn(2)-C6 fungal-type domain-containing protein [Fusarium keratoplasticum]